MKLIYDHYIKAADRAAQEFRPGSTVFEIDTGNGYSKTNSGWTKTQTDGSKHMSRPADLTGVMEVGEITAEIASNATTTLTLNNGTNIKIATITYIDEDSSVGDSLLVGFPGTPFNDPSLPGVRRVVPKGESRTFVFSDDMPATGINVRMAITSLVDTHRVVWEVMYA